MSRLRDALTERAPGAGFVPFLSSGFPSPADTPRLLRALAEAGADVIELGIPFSDPLADGPTIQAASQRALDQGVSIQSTLKLVADVAGDLPPLVLFTYLNPVLRMGVERFLDRAEAAGAAGLLITDLPSGTHSEFEGRLGGSALDLIPLIAPTTPASRIDSIAGRASGFVYYISRLGVTGTREAMEGDIGPRVSALRERIHLPVAVGFGVSTPEQARQVAAVADGVVVGSALIAALGRSEPDFVRLAGDLARATHGEM